VYASFSAHGPEPRHLRPNTRCSRGRIVSMVERGRTWCLLSLLRVRRASGPWEGVTNPTLIATAPLTRIADSSGQLATSRCIQRFQRRHFIFAGWGCDGMVVNNRNASLWRWLSRGSHYCRHFSALASSQHAQLNRFLLRVKFSIIAITYVLEQLLI
jgi:hypothetical protein